MKNFAIVFTPIFFCAGIPSKTCAADRPLYPHQAELCLEGHLRGSTHVGLGYFSKVEKTNRQVDFVCENVLKGDWKNKETYPNNVRLMRFYKLKNSNRLLVLSRPTGFYPALAEIPELDTPENTVAQVKKLLKSIDDTPAGGGQGLGLRLAKPRLVRKNFQFEFDVINWSLIPWTVNVDKKVSRKPNSHNRAVYVTIYKKGEMMKKGVLQRPVYSSDRPWVGQFVMTTAANNTRPSRPVSGATVRLAPGKSYTGKVELRSLGRGSTYQVFINGHRDLGKPVELPAGEYEVRVQMDDDYHYYVGNGSRVGVRDYWFGKAVSNPATLKIEK